ncbi:hypothetical protein P8C59_003971 [Phyllachora maydis]|uniref:Pre-mRNA-splicing factor 3 domain-containing protein n=1 Tax=Phyllachora maydis TaxID=1825666 RepID=A0AAD9I2H3_9PEZI|nr:hypothetical protein P8C59_003971 [Phyllachora maydis]
MDKLAALKARVAAAVGSTSTNRGLAVELHPALSDLGSSKPLYEQKKRTESRSNPYLEAAPASLGPTGKERPTRSLQFNPKGKYIQQGNALRRQAALEAMKARIAEQTRKAGIDEIPSEKNFVVEAPPDVEWFDESYFPEGRNYSHFSDSEFTQLIERVCGSDGLISDLIQHPIPIEPPQDKLIPDAKPLYMTRQEQKKLRRQRRMAAMKESQAKQRLGLEPTPKPKVKLSSLMRVLGNEAIQDPTAVEARVHKEIAERHQQHT